MNERMLSKTQQMHVTLQRGVCWKREFDDGGGEAACVSHHLMHSLPGYTCLRPTELTLVFPLQTVADLEPSAAMCE